jgi:hypothetical protein
VAKRVVRWEGTELIEVTRDAMQQKKGVRDALAEAASYSNGQLAGA